MISRLALGTVQFGLDYGINNSRGQISPAEVFQILDLAASRGIDTLDTAANYGESETVIGQYLRNHPGAFKIISKLPAIKDETEIKTNLDASLERLGVSRLHGYFCHSFQTIVDFPDTIERLRADGRADKVGLSLYYPHEIDHLIERKINFDIVQLPYNIFDQRFAADFARLKDRGVEIHVRSVFLQGLVFRSPDQIVGHFVGLHEKIKSLRAIASETGLSISSLCLNFALLNPLIDKVVIGVDSQQNLADNLLSVDESITNKVKSHYDPLLKLKEDDETIIIPANWPKK